MPRNAEDVETFLYRLNRTFERNEESLFLVASGDDGPPIVVYINEPIVVVRVDIGPPPKDERKHLPLYRHLLELNAKLVHAAYALEDGEVTLGAGLALENVDQNELAAVLSDIDLALALHMPKLRELMMES